MISLRQLAFILPVIATFAMALQAQTGPVVVTGGSIHGRMLPDSGALFEGIPFAQPPVGDLRWKEPQPVRPWTGVRDAFEPAATCPQVPQGWNDAFAAVSQEDCLYLSVWAPEWPAKVRRPVMVWMHGGGNTGGAGGFDPLYGGWEMRKRGVVLVIIQYRLGALGFLAHPELTREAPRHVSGNYAILDQVAALRWVRDNIARFGGDPGNVTIFGQSAGAMNVAVLLNSPLAAGLFHRAIQQSGATAGRRLPTLEQAESTGTRWASRIKPGIGLADLRAMPVHDLLKLPQISGINLDGYVFTADAKVAAVPLLLGSNAIEFPSNNSPEQLRQSIEQRYGSVAPKALALYQHDDPVYGRPADQFATDTQFRCPTVVQAGQHAAAGNAVWLYEFDRAIPPARIVEHSSELPYMFGNLWAAGNKAGEYTDADRNLSRAMVAYWTNFARSGDPNGDGLPAWPKHETASRKFLRFTTEAAIGPDADQRGAACALFAESVK